MTVFFITGVMIVPTLLGVGLAMFGAAEKTTD